MHGARHVSVDAFLKLDFMRVILIIMDQWFINIGKLNLCCSNLHEGLRMNLFIRLGYIWC